MKLPRLEGRIERRLLVNYRVDPDVIAMALPAPLRPQLVNGWAVAGICLIRLGELRPPGFPRVFGRRSENAAHRIAIEWDSDGGTSTGVFIPRRDSNAITNVLLGGRVFPGAHHYARFSVNEHPQALFVGFESSDRTASVDVSATLVDELPPSALFRDVGEASQFFARGSAGYSATRDGTRLDGLELTTRDWRVEPLAVVDARSTFFDDEEVFPRGSAVLDCALLMRDLAVEWEALPSLHLASTGRQDRRLSARGRDARRTAPRGVSSRRR